MTEARCEEARPLAEARGFALAWAPGPDGLPAAWADGELYETIVLNLVGNTRKFTPRGGRVRVGVGEAAGGRLELWVEDEGPGIATSRRGCSFGASSSSTARRRGASRAWGWGWRWSGSLPS